MRSRCFVALAAMALAASACTGSSPGLPGPTADGLYAVRDRPAGPALAGDAVSGASISAAQSRGRIAVVNFWGSWCGPCRAEASALAEVARATAPSGVVFLGVNIKEDKPAAARFERQHRTPYPSIFDQSGSVLARFRSLAPQETPSTVLLDREGRIARVLPGAIDVPVLLPLVRRLVEQEPQS